MSKQIAMPRHALLPLVLVLLLFGLEGAAVWLGSFSVERSGKLSLGAWLGWNGAILAWWALWPALHVRRGWQPWVEMLAVMAVTYWPAMLLDPLVRERGDGQFLDVAAILHGLVTMVVLLTFPLAMLLHVARWPTGWRLLPPADAPNFGLRGMFVLTALAAGHLVFLQRSLRPVSDWLLHDFSWVQLLLPGAVFLLAIPAAVMTLAVAAICHHRQGVRWLWIVVLLISAVVLCLVGGWFSSWDREVLAFSGMGCVGVALNGALIALALRWIGYRLTTAATDVFRR